MKPLEYKTGNHLTTSRTLCRCLSQTTTNKQKYKPNHQQTGLPPHSALPIRGKTKQASKQTNKKLSKNLTLFKTYTNHSTNLRGAETKRKKEFNLEDCKKEISNTISLKENNEKAEKYHINEGTN